MSWRPDLDVWDEDPKGLYGLKPRFLKSLGITPPIDKWVHVTNFRCGSTELKEVMELSGHVIICSVFMVRGKHAKVMYSHPLEAVQAVSMLNNQMLYGQPLKIVMGRCPTNTVILPKGLADIGPGLGACDKPLRDIVRQFERYAQGHHSLINEMAFQHPDDQFLSFLDEYENDSNDASHKDDITKAIEAIKELDSRGITPNHLREALEEYTREQHPSRSFQVQNVDLIDMGVDVLEANDQYDENPSAPLEKEFNSHFTQSSHNSNFSAVVSKLSPNSNPIKSPAPADTTASSIWSPSSTPGVSSTSHNSNAQNPVPAAAIEVSLMRSRIGSFSNTTSVMNTWAMGSSMPSSASVQISSSAVRSQGYRPGQIPQPIAPIGSSSGFRHNTPLRVSLPIPMRPMSSAAIARPYMMTRAQGIVAGAVNQMVLNPRGSATVQINNLPRSASFGIVSEKLSHCGQVVSLQLSAYGSAVVQFANRIQAENCFKQINNSTLDGCLISVQFV